MARERERQVEAIRRVWPELRDLAWRWDPIGLGEEAREFADDEYDCVIDFVVGRLLASRDATELPQAAVGFIRDDMGIGASLTSANTFVESARRIVSTATGK